MSHTDVSVIIPVRNIERDINSILKAIALDMCGIDIEVIIVDMASNDSTVCKTLNSLKVLNLSGCVIQSGGSSIGSALNHGIYRAKGDYVTFVFPRKLYTNCVTDYFSLAKEKNADMVFGTPPTVNANSRIFLENPDALVLVEGIVFDTLAIDSASVLISRGFLTKNYLNLAENLRTGYMEKFIIDVLLRADNVARSKTVMTRNKEAEAEKIAHEPIGAECFDRVEAIASLCDTVPLAHPNRKYIVDILKGEKLPVTVLSCADSLLREGYGHKAVKNALKEKHYDEYLISNKYTSLKTRKRIFAWKMAPLMYKPL